LIAQPGYQTTGTNMKRWFDCFDSTQVIFPTPSMRLNDGSDSIVIKKILRTLGFCAFIAAMPLLPAADFNWRPGVDGRAGR
jgi:hypothetical protein